MNIHENARLTPCRREKMAVAVIEGRLSKAQAGRVFGVYAKIVARWTQRFKTGGCGAMVDRSSRPRHSPRQTAPALALRVTELRRQRLTGAHIALETGVSPATVSRILKRAGLSRIRDIEPAAPSIRYEYSEPCGIIHLDIKRLVRFDRVGHRITGDRAGQSNRRGVGWDPRPSRHWSEGWPRVDVCIDDCSRIAVTAIFPNEKAVSAIASLRAAVAY